MWMGCDMTPMSFPGFQQYLSNFGVSMGIGHAPMSSIPSPIQLPGVPPLLNQSVPTSLANQINFPYQMQNVHIPDQYAYHSISPQVRNIMIFVCSSLRNLSFIFLRRRWMFLVMDLKQPSGIKLQHRCLQDQVFEPVNLLRIQHRAPAQLWKSK